jgi:hypothetical protein
MTDSNLHNRVDSCNPAQADSIITPTRPQRTQNVQTSAERSFHKSLYYKPMTRHTMTNRPRNDKDKTLLRRNTKQSTRPRRSRLWTRSCSLPKHNEGFHHKQTITTVRPLMDSNQILRILATESTMRIRPSRWKTHVTSNIHPGTAVADHMKNLRVGG